MPQRPVNDQLREAVREYALFTEGCDPLRVTIRYANGASSTLKIPPSFFRDSLPPVGGDVEKPDEQKSGWVLGHKSASYNGTSVRIGRTAVWLVLRVLVEAEGEWVSAADARSAAWPDYEVDQRTVNNTISLLRKSLRVALGDTDPILCEGGSYRLAEGLLT
jgi:hypothetical protein